jgi:DNA-damage-inducible protein J
MSDTVIRARVDLALKDEANQLFQRLGLTMSDAIRLFLHQAVAEQALPFAIKVPNPTTVAAMEAVERGQGLETVTLDQLAQEWETACVR